ncbi:hypothetical protein [Halorubrum sp. Atlit-26R]|uniref:hypothetical protein n=1 Tax=Halorubrum sp. Atlit-26R TaxID=2282128 RepID=UPI000EF20BC0|nr:hypothetical protein [Halorubrum sp. Atlit-26R]RLM60038.1 hypothetical protein DVK07_19890 [Halorubrum sp. Atlit-26R]
MIRLTKLVALGAFTVAIASLTVMWGLFGTMWVRGETSILVAASRYDEFLPEFVLLTLAMIFLPVLLYEVDQLLSR